MRSLRERRASSLPLLLLAFFAVLAGCGPVQLIGYWLHPDAPRFENGARVALPALQDGVTVVHRTDGLWKISAKNEADAMRVQGYLVARDRMFQLDLFRHMALGELAALLGDRQMGEKTALQTDVLNRALGFGTGAEEMLAATSAQERELLSAYAGGINAWIKQGHLSIEHRLLGSRRVRDWQAVDSLSIYLMLSHSLSGNADREIRRLRVACEIGVDAMEQVFPTTVEFGTFTLPPADVGTKQFPVAVAVVPELREELESLCRQGRDDALQRTPAPLRRAAAPAPALALLGGLSSLSASNNWVVSGALTRSGKPVLSSDPHLPHMNPPIMWGVEIETPDNHVAGFTIPGLHRVVFGHNGHVAWGATTNHVDRQDLVIHKARHEERNGHTVDGYDIEGEFVAFDVRKERFEVKDGEAVEVGIRFTKDGPLLNDIEPLVSGKIPLTALRVASIGAGRDLDGAAQVNRARTISDFSAAIQMFDQGCSNWVFADDQGGIGYRSPCRVPIRRAWRGTFPIPGWLRRYEWEGYIEKDQLPSSTNPARAWIATANSDIVPQDSLPTAYNNDSSAPWRLSRIAARIQVEVPARLTPEASSAIQLDLFQPFWPMIRGHVALGFCAAENVMSASEDEALRQRLCAWTGKAAADSVETSLFNLWSNAVLDHALADALPGGATSATWHFVQTLPQFESVAQWLWTRPQDDRIWDDVTTPPIEGATVILKAAFQEAAAQARRRWGADVQRWQWGEVRPFVLRHLFATNDGLVGRLLNSPALHIGGDNESVFKHQFLRSDRAHMKAAIGPVVRFTVDMADPWRATYTLAGGESGWPGSEYYGNLLADWAEGKGRALTPADPGAGAITVRFGP